jgi:formylglycine-generating enzyme required for sulfatase activity
MLGNVREWTADCWRDDYEGAPSDGGARTEGGDCGRRALRGGSWADGERLLRYANRDQETPDTGAAIHGLRVARALEANEVEASP